MKLMLLQSRWGETICVSINPEENLCRGEILILAGENKALAKLMQKI